MNKYILAVGKQIVSNEAYLKDPNRFTEELLAFKKQIDDVIIDSFKNDMLFQKARDASFQEFMNTCKFTPHYMVIYIDHQYKIGFKQKQIKEIDGQLDTIVRLFCCLHGRDVFINSYTGLLASRLLNKTSVSDDAEKLLVTKLAIECGHNTVNKIKTMFEDIVKSEEMLKEFKHKNGNTIQNIELTVEILTSGHWPYQEIPECKVPKQLLKV